MAKFYVRVARIAPQICGIEVEVPEGLSEEESLALASEKALEKAYNLDFSGMAKEATYEIDEIHELE